MTTKPILTLCAAALVLTFGTSVAEGHSPGAPDTCGIKRAEIRHLTNHARVVEKYYGDDDRSVFWACLNVIGRDSAHVVQHHGFKRRRFLGEVVCDQDGCGWEIALADSQHAFRRPKVAFSKIVCSRYVHYCRTWARVIDIRSGRAASTEFTTDSGPLYFNVTGTGTALWLERHSWQGPGSFDRIRALTLADDEIVIDEAPELSELALTRNTLYWLRDGEPQTTQVPSAPPSD